MTLRRSLLFVPADRPERIEKATKLPADVVVLELEDGITPDHKDEARRNAGRCLASLDFGTRETAVRINRITSRAGLDDLLVLADWSRKPDLLLLPKVESSSEVEIYDWFLTDCGASCLLMPLIESARGLLAARDIASASERVAGIAFGGGDLSVDLGCQFSWDALLPYRAAVVLAATAAGVPVVDVPFVNIQDEDGLRGEAQAARRIGMKGKVCIHPNQLEAVNEAFSPSTDEVAQARTILDAAAAGVLPFVVNGQMIDAPLVRLSENIIASADRANLASS